MTTPTPEQDEKRPPPHPSQSDLWDNVVVCTQAQGSKGDLTGFQRSGSSPLLGFRAPSSSDTENSEAAACEATRFVTTMGPDLADQFIGSDADRRLERLLSYTTFHIGMYASIFTAVVGYLKLASDLPSWMPATLALAAAALLVAGASGGIIAGHIPHYRYYDHFLKAKLSPRLLRTIGVSDRWGYEELSFVEHTAFWIAVTIISATLLIAGI